MLLKGPTAVLSLFLKLRESLTILRKIELIRNKKRPLEEQLQPLWKMETQCLSTVVRPLIRLFVSWKEGKMLILLPTMLQR